MPDDVGIVLVISCLKRIIFGLHIRDLSFELSNPVGKSLFLVKLNSLGGAKSYSACHEDCFADTHFDLVCFFVYFFLFVLCSELFVFKG